MEKDHSNLAISFFLQEIGYGLDYKPYTILILNLELLFVLEGIELI